MNAYVLVIVIMSGLVVAAVPTASGHGLGLESVLVAVQDRSVELIAELPTRFEDNTKRLTLTLQDTLGVPIQASINLVVLHSDDIILNQTLPVDGMLPIDITTEPGDVLISGGIDGVRISGPVFETGGLYTLLVNIRSLDGQDTPDAPSAVLDLLVADPDNHAALDIDGSPVEFTTRSYFERVSEFSHDPEAGLVTFTIPFEWRESRMSHIPVIHQEVHFAQEYDDFMARGYTAGVNGVDLFKSSVTVDDFTTPGERTIHIVILQDHLNIIKSNMERPNGTLPDTMTFTIQKTADIRSQLSAYTASDDFQVDMTWEPEEILPDQDTKFIFTIRDTATGETLRNSEYDFVLIQDGQTIHHVSGMAVVGGDFVSYTFDQSQTGPTILRIENIRDTGQHVEFGFMVVPEFGIYALLILALSISAVILLARRNAPFWYAAGK